MKSTARVLDWPGNLSLSYGEGSVVRVVPQCVSLYCCTVSLSYREMEHSAYRRTETRPTVPDRLRVAIATCLDRHPKIGLGIAYGSLQRGTAGPESDLDLAVLGTRTLPAAEKMTIIEDLARRVGRPIDLVDLRTASSVLLGEVLRSGARVYEADPGLYPRLVQRYLLDVADFMPYRDRILAERRRAWTGE